LKYSVQQVIAISGFARQEQFLEGKESS
jgi:hypothetical protein